MRNDVGIMHTLARCIDELEAKLMFVGKDEPQFRELMEECDQKYAELYSIADEHTGPVTDIPEMIRFMYLD